MTFWNLFSSQFVARDSVRDCGSKTLVCSKFELILERIPLSCTCDACKGGIADMCVYSKLFWNVGILAALEDVSPPSASILLCSCQLPLLPFHQTRPAVANLAAAQSALGSAQRETEKQSLGVQRVH